MTLLLLLLDKRVAALEVLLDEGIIDLGDALFTLPFDIGGFHRQKWRDQRRLSRAEEKKQTWAIDLT